MSTKPLTKLEPMMIQETLLSADRACEILANCSKRKLARLVKQGHLKPRPFDGNTVYLLSEIQAFIQSIVDLPPGRALYRGPTPEEVAS